MSFLENQLTPGNAFSPIYLVSVQQPILMRLLEFLQVLLVLYQMRVLLVEGALSETPPLNELSVDEKNELPATPTTVGKEMDICKHIVNMYLFTLPVDCCVQPSICMCWGCLHRKTCSRNLFQFQVFGM